MRPPSFAPAYCWMYPGLADVARACGYALAIHGTVQRDVDLVAVPWRESAATVDVLVARLAEYAHRLSPYADNSGEPHGPEQKAHGRLAWIIPLGSGAAIDLSVFPPARPGATKESET